MWSSTVILILLSSFVGLGVWLFFLYAAKSGHFDDTEDTSQRMMQDDDEPLK